MDDRIWRLALLVTLLGALEIRMAPWTRASEAD